MTKEYFKQVPNFEYPSTEPGSDSSSYNEVKNLFKRAKIRDDIFQNLSYFEKYTIVGEERPDQIANLIYDDPTLDWVILLSNNIQNLYEEWPKSQDAQTNYLLKKYGSFDNLYNGIHHYETIEIKDFNDNIVIEKGIIVNEDYYNAPEFSIELDSTISLPTIIPGVFAQATAEVDTDAGRLTKLVLTNLGSGYTGDVEIEIDPPEEGVQAVVEFELNAPPANREVGDFTIINSGRGYTAQPSLIFSEPTPTIPCELEAVIGAGGSISSINILNPGEGYTFIPTIIIDQPEDIFSNAILDSTSNFTVESSGWEGFYFDSIGQKLYTCHGNNLYTEGIIEYYNLTSSFDITTGSKVTELDLDTVSGGISIEYVTGIEFRPNGSRFYVSAMTSSGFYILQYDLSIDWDISTATISGTFATSECAGIRFRDNGSTFFIVDLLNPDSIYQYELTQDWNISSTITNPISSVNIFSIVGESSVRGFSFKDDGSRLYISGTDTNSIHILEFSSKWNLSTLSLIGSKDTSAQDSTPLDVYTNFDETLFIVGGADTNKFYTYDIDIRATATAILGIGSSSEQIAEITITKGGAGYSEDNLPNVIIQPPIPSRRAEGYVLLENNQLKDIIITDPGYGYLETPIGTVSPPLPRITATGQASANESGNVVQISLKNPGLGYTSSPNITFNKPNPLYKPEEGEIFRSNKQEWRYDGFNWRRRLTFGTRYYDSILDKVIEVPGNLSSVPVTNFEYEQKIEDKKRSIYILKPSLLPIILDDIESVMPYKKGSEQYVSKTLKRGYNPNFYE
jgi:hypothetical protein